MHAASKTTLILVLGMIAGCSVHVHAPPASEALVAALDRGSVVAFAGVTTDPAVGVFTPPDAIAADDAALGGIASAYPTLTVWATPAVADVLGDPQLAALRDEYGRLGGLAIARVRALAAGLPGASLLALARLEADDVHTDTVVQDQANPEARVSGQPEHSTPWAMTMSTERKIRVAMEIFDLQTGASLWRGQADVRDRIRYEYKPPSIDPQAIARRSAAASDSAIVRTGEFLKRPDIVPMIGNACHDLTTRLPGVPKDAS